MGGGGAVRFRHDTESEGDCLAEEGEVPYMKEGGGGGGGGVAPYPPVQLVQICSSCFFTVY